MFHIIGMNLSAAQFLGNLSMILAEFTAIRSDRHLCAGFGICIDFFYTSAAMFLMLEAHAVFRATTSGIIGGKTKVISEIDQRNFNGETKLRFCL